MNSSVEERILDAAFEVVDTYTISGTRMHLIAEKAGMSQANLHYHYKTKKDLLIALLDYLQCNFSVFRDEILKKAPATLQGKMSVFFEQKKYYTICDPKYDRVQIDYWSCGQIDEQINKSINESYRVWFENIMGVMLDYRPKMDPEKAKILAHIMISMMLGSTMQYLANPNFDLDRHNQTCLELLCSALDAD
ncbi:MAG: TetR/AcrR family transcriptional regulator [Bacillota bacterium]